VAAPFSEPLPLIGLGNISIIVALKTEQSILVLCSVSKLIETLVFMWNGLNILDLWGRSIKFNDNK